MLAAKVLEAFSAGNRHVLSCHVPHGNPHNFVNKEMWVCSSANDRRRLQVDGMSTASDMERGVYDFHYSGTVIRPEEITELSVLTDAGYEEAVEWLGREHQEKESS